MAQNCRGADCADPRGPKLSPAQSCLNTCYYDADEGWLLRTTFSRETDAATTQLLLPAHATAQ